MWTKTPADPDRRQALLVTGAAAAVGIALGFLLGLLANGVLGVGQGYVAILVSVVALGAASALIERLRPRSGAPIAVLVVAALLASGPLGLYYVLPAVVIVTPVALYRALKQKYV